MLAFAELVKANSEQIAQVIAKETGKPLWETRTEAASIAGKIAISIRAYHERTGETVREAAGNQLVLRHRPLGVMAVFGPYNFPATCPMGILCQLCSLAIPWFSNLPNKRRGLAKF